MIAKLLLWDEKRARAVLRLRRALTEYRVGGLTTNIAFLHNLVREKDRDSASPSRNG